MQRPGWAPAAIDLERPSVARMYDYFLGGSHNFAVDREAAHQILAIMPDVPLRAQANRAFLRRAVRYLLGAGVRQFLDIGSGIPTVGNVHEVAQQAAPDSRVVYVDVDPVAVAHSQELLAGDDRSAVIQEDLRRPDRILTHPVVRELLDLREPVAVLLVAVLHFVPDADAPHAAVAAIRDALAPGSYLALSHANVTAIDAGDLAAGQRVYDRSDGSFFSRPTGEVARFFDGFTLVEPGLVWVPRWRPDPGSNTTGAEQAIMLGGVARLGDVGSGPGGTGQPGG
ncbi:MAG: SAM-dependent methyltransferase [Natronosporangium sp.]